MWKYCFLPQTLWMEEFHFEEPSAPTPCRGSVRQGTHWGRLLLCPYTGHHTPCPGPESLFLFVILCNSCQMHLRSSTPLRSLSLCFGFTIPILFGVVPPDTKPGWGAATSSGLSAMLWFQPSRQMSLLCWLQHWNGKCWVNETCSEQNMSIFFSITLEFSDHWCYRLQTYLPSSWNSHQTTCEVRRRKVGSPLS